MLTLGFDTSAAHCAIALVSGQDILAERYEVRAKGQAERLMPLIEEVLAHASVRYGDLDIIGTGIGPGNFTGIRISVSAARGLALSLGIPAIGVSQPEVLAFGTTGPVLTSIDARQNKIYVQGFEGDAIEEVTLKDPEALPDSCHRPGLHVIGHKADEIAARMGVATHPFDPATTGARIAWIAASRMGQNWPRPAPLYVRAPDAAPARDRPIVILDA